ncbi:MAG: hypothetical protein V4616_14000 [Bacteroidota bacterium]
MKKLTLIAAVAVFAIAAVSCKKDHTCVCTSTTTFNGQTTTTSAEGKIKETKKKAKDSCESGSVTSGATKVECKLK